MNWPKAKTILIIGFLCLNAYLGYLLFYLPSVTAIQTSITATDLDNLVTLSKHYNVDLIAHPQPMKVEPLPALALAEIRLDEYLAESLALLWLGEDAQETKQENALLFTSGQKKLLLSQEHPYFYTIEYQTEEPVSSPLSLSWQEAAAIAETFLLDHLGKDMMRDYEMNLAVADPDYERGFIIEISRMYEGFPVFLDSYRLHVHDGAIASFTAKQADIGEVERPAATLVSAEQAIKRYLAKLGVPQQEVVTVFDLRLGYGVSLAEGGSLALEPVWRFCFSGSETGETSIEAAHIYWQHGGG